jgi:hypothetical protein
VCGFHALNHGVNQIAMDGNPAGLWEITGQPHAYNLGASRRDLHHMALGCFNCGCEEKEVLLEFYLWKTWSLTQIMDQVIFKKGKPTNEFTTARTVTQG